MYDKRIVIVGGGVAGKTLAAELLKRQAQAKVIVIEQKEYFEVPFAQLRGLTDPEGFAREIREPLAELLPGVEIARGRAVGLGYEEVKLEDSRGVAYDWLVMATGSSFGQWLFLKGIELTVAERDTAFRSVGRTLAGQGACYSSEAVRWEWSWRGDCGEVAGQTGYDCAGRHAPLAIPEREDVRPIRAFAEGDGCRGPDGS
jgi:choline dehydrogenase-like flavoprotein